MTDFCGLCTEKGHSWHCEICKRAGKAREAYIPHLRLHDLGELVAAVDPEIGWPMAASHALRIPLGDLAAD